MAKTFIEELEPVLMLVPYFAPQSHAAMFRAHKLAKYLPENGFKPIIVTTDVNYIYNEDPALVEELPDEVEIHRARYIEPTLRGLRMALGGRDRTFATQKATLQANPPTSELLEAVSLQQDKHLKIGAKVRQLISENPDRHWTWVGPAYRMASRLIAERGIRLLYTSANPVSFLRAAIRLKKKHDLVWLADNRDPLGYGRKHKAPKILPMLQEREILREAMALADHVSGLSRSYGSIFFDEFGLSEEKYSFIPTGLDTQYIEQASTSPNKDYILHVGNVMADSANYSFLVLQSIMAKKPEKFRKLKLVFVGRLEVNVPRVRQMLRNTPELLDRIDFVDHVPQAEVYRLIQDARACLLAPGSSRYWWNNFAKMVDYIALSTPVIAHVPPVSEARHELEQVGMTCFLEGDFAADAAKLSNWLENCSALSATDYSKRYTVHRQVEDIATLFHKLLTLRGSARA